MLPKRAGMYLCLDLSSLPKIYENRWRRNIYQVLNYMEQTTAVPLVCIELSVAGASCIFSTGEWFQKSCRLGSSEDVSLGSFSTATGCPRTLGIVTSWASMWQTLLARASYRWWCWDQASWQKQCVFSKIGIPFFPTEITTIWSICSSTASQTSCVWVINSKFSWGFFTELGREEWVKCGFHHNSKKIAALWNFCQHPLESPPYVTQESQVIYPVMWPQSKHHADIGIYVRIETRNLAKGKQLTSVSPSKHCSELDVGKDTTAIKHLFSMALGCISAHALDYWPENTLQKQICCLSLPVHVFPSTWHDQFPIPCLGSILPIARQRLTKLKSLFPVLQSKSQAFSFFVATAFSGAEFFQYPCLFVVFFLKSH